MSEWIDEPDREEFEHSGLKCLILRDPDLKMLCGYVGVLIGHLCYGRHCDSFPYRDLLPVRVHGGLTFSEVGDGEWRQRGYWWFGFDTAHGWDLVPKMRELEIEWFNEPYWTSYRTYKNFQYVRKNVESLADHLVTVEFIDWEFTWVWPFLLPIRAARWIWSRKGHVSRALSRMNEGEALFSLGATPGEKDGVKGLNLPIPGKPGEPLFITVSDEKPGFVVASHRKEDCVKGSKKTKCVDCHRKVWTSPSTRELFKRYPDTPVICVYCFKKRVEEEGDSEDE